MSEPLHPVDQLIRNLAGDPNPTAEERAVTFERFEQLVAKEAATKRSRVVLRIAVAVGLVVALVGGALLIPSSNAVADTFEELAELVETVDAVIPAEGSYVYTSSESLALIEIPLDGFPSELRVESSLFYHLPILRETWLGENSTVRVSSTALEPTFFSEDDRDLYYSAGIDERDRIGITDTATFEDPQIGSWPMDPTELDSAIRSRLPVESTRPESIEYLDAALIVIRESSASPATRAGTLRLIAEIDGLEHLDNVLEDGISRFRIQFTELGVDKEWTFGIDNDGYIREESQTNLTPDEALGLPAGVVTFAAEYSAPVTVDSLDSPASDN